MNQISINRQRRKIYAVSQALKNCEYVQETAKGQPTLVKPDQNLRNIRKYYSLELELITAVKDLAKMTKEFKDLQNLESNPK